MRLFSKEIREILAMPSTRFAPWSREKAAQRELNVEPLSSPHRRLEEELFEASEGRGLPTLGAYVLGVAEASSSSGAPASLSRERFGRATLWAWSPERGPLYLSENGDVLQSGGEFVTDDVRAELARMAIEATTPITLGLVFARGSASQVARLAKLEFVNEASDEWFDVWKDAHVWLVSGSFAMIHANSFRAVETLVRRCASAPEWDRPDFFLYPRSPASELDDDSDGETAPARDAAVDKAGKFNHRTVEVEPNEAGLIQRTIWSGRTTCKTVMQRHNSGLVVRYKASAARHLRGHLSAQAIRYCEANGFAFDPSKAYNFDAFAQELDRRGLAFYDAWFDFEERFGGIQFPFLDPLKTTNDSLGVWQFLTASERQQQKWAVESDDIFTGPWPTFSWREKSFILAGHLSDDGRLMIDNRGAVYHMFDSLGAPEIVADNGVCYIEKAATAWKIHNALAGRPCIQMSGDVAPHLAKRLGLQPIATASDTHSQFFYGHSSWLLRQVATRSGRVETFYYARAPRQAVMAAKLVREADANARVSVGNTPLRRSFVTALSNSGFAIT